MKTIVVGLFAAITLTFVTVGASADAPPLAPVNLRVVSATQTSVTLAWGPSAPSDYSIVTEDKNSVTIGWTASQNDTEPVTSYTVWKDGTVVGTVTTNQFKFGGMPGKKAKTFRICTQANTASGLKSVQACGTVTKL